MTTTEFLEYLSRYDTTRELATTFTALVEHQRAERDALLRARALAAHTPHAA
jgi:hypothetical protein